jgi:hypothetical protein
MLPVLPPPAETLTAETAETVEHGVASSMRAAVVVESLLPGLLEAAALAVVVREP